jgi:hypothetical protein
MYSSLWLFRERDIAMKEVYRDEETGTERDQEKEVDFLCYPEVRVTAIQQSPTSDIITVTIQIFNCDFGVGIIEYEYASIFAGLNALQQLAVSQIPLRCEYLRQASLFEERTYPLPQVLPGQEAIIADADCQIFNFRRGIVTAYSYFTGLYTINQESNFSLGFSEQEIVRAT